ncbi:hypothetical protein DFH08DRAFT_825048 [Mycena albidolilacea]|uniref:Uncharacterized protein n=1 Tax=Mycena albidolilacea TaxID=1033008 RepID=A0AAD7E9Q1_9AGAR|nr:hypothetical protein DFH08DRAFT_825048 [Mycena albidolilacea]
MVWQCRLHFPIWSLFSLHTQTPFISATSPAAPAEPATLHTTLSTIMTHVPQADDMMDTNIKLFKGDGIAENTIDFLNTIWCRTIVGILKDGSYASNWFVKLAAMEKKMFKDLVAVFRLKWLVKEMAEKSKGEVQEELLSLRLATSKVGVCFEDDGIQEWGHVHWALKVADLGAQADPGGALIPQALKNIPDSLFLHLGLTTAFSGMSKLSPARACANPPYRPDPEPADDQGSTSCHPPVHLSWAGCIHPATHQVHAEAWGMGGASHLWIDPTCSYRAVLWWARGNATSAAKSATSLTTATQQRSSTFPKWK